MTQPVKRWRPQRPGRRLMFGDGNQAQLIDIIQGKKDREGHELLGFRFRPLEHMFWKDNIQDEEYTDQREWFIEKFYPKDKCLLVDPSPFTMTWIIMLTWRGNPGLEIEGLNKELELRLNMAQDENEILRKSLARFKELLNTLAETPDVYKSEVIDELTNQLRAAGIVPKVPTPAGSESEPNEQSN